MKRVLIVTLIAFAVFCLLSFIQVICFNRGLSQWTEDAILLRIVISYTLGFLVTVK